MNELSTIITPAVTNLYGGRIGSPANLPYLIECLVERLEQHRDNHYQLWRSREDMVRETCLMVFTGASVTDQAAWQVEAALLAAGCLAR